MANITFILPDCITQTERTLNNNNNEDTIKVKYLTLTRLKAEYSNLLIIIAGYAALNQQLHWENAWELMLKYREKAKAKGRKSARGGGSVSNLNTAWIMIREFYIFLPMLFMKSVKTIQPGTPQTQTL